MNWESIFSALDKPESFLAIILLILAFILGMIFNWIWLGGRIKDARKELEAEQMKNSGLMGKNAELENEAKIHLADANRIKIENREMVAQKETLLQEKDRLYSQVMMLSESETLLKDQLDDVNSRYMIMETSHQKMNSSLAQVSSDFEMSVAQKDDLHSRIAELEATNQDLVETRIRENASYRTQLNSLRESLNHLQTENTIAKNDLVGKTEELDSFRSKYLSIKNEYDTLLSSHQNIVPDLETKTTKLERQQDTINALLVKQNAYIIDLEAAKEDVNGFKAVASDLKNKKLSMVYNRQTLSLQEALEAANNNLAALEAEKAKISRKLKKNKTPESTQEDNSQVIANASNPMSSSFDDSNEISLAVELNVVKKQLKAEHQSRIEQQQEADRWRASLITLKADLSQAEENRAKEQEKLKLETQKLLKATTKIEELEAKVTWLETITDDAETDTVDFKTGQSNDGNDIKLGETTDEKSSDIQALEAENDQVITAAKEQIDALNLQVDRAEAKATHLEARLNDAENDLVELEEKYAKILSIENDKYAAAKENTLRLETQIGLLETKSIRLEAAAKDANTSLMEQLAEAKMKAASNIPIIGNTNPVENTTSDKDVLSTSTRMDASLEGDVMDSYQATKAFKKLIGTEIPATSKQKDNIKTIKGIGKHLEEGLNHLGINSFQQISSLTDKHIQLIRRALDIYPGRIEQDNWIGQAKKFYKNNDDLTPETAKIAVQALLGHKIPVAKAKSKDDLKLIKGIGGFLENKLNDIGIYTFKQISTFDKDAIEKVTMAIEFFPERIKRDKWVKQAKALM